MNDVATLYEEFRNEHRDTGSADPKPYLLRATPDNRAALADQIDAYLAALPRREWDEAEFEASPARRVLKQLEQDLLRREGDESPPGAG